MKMLFKKVLIAFDGSESSKRALGYAADIASGSNAVLTVLTVVPRLYYPLYPEDGFMPSVRSGPADYDYETRMREIYKASLDAAVADLRKRYESLDVVPALIEGRPGNAIVEEAEKRGVDLIVIGSRGLGGVTGWILGSTSRHVAEHCTKPVLVIK